MMGYTIADLCRLEHARAENLEPVMRTTIKSISTDSRTMKTGEAFVALRGPNFDGHEYLKRVLTLHPCVCIVSLRWYLRNGLRFPHAPLFVVKDPLRTYGDVARDYRKRFAIPVIAVTGSNGKTGTKELIAAVLSTRYNVLYSEGNLNNHVGLPATLLRLRNAHQAAVVELGTNQPGDIPYLCTISNHTHAVVTNVGRAHTEKLGSRENIAREKAAVYATLPSDGVSIVNADELYLRPHARNLKHKVTYGSKRGADVRITALQLDEDARPNFLMTAPEYTSAPVRVHLQTAGRHAAWNAAAAFTVGLTLDCAPEAMKNALERHRGFRQRLQIHRAGAVTIVDDAYNANPDSVLAALDTFMRMRHDGERIVVLGDMLELGKSAKADHRMIGEHVSKLKIPYVLTHGKLSREIFRAASMTSRYARHYRDKRELIADLVALVTEGDAVLVKGSRGMRMEEVVTALSRAYQGKERF